MMRIEISKAYEKFRRRMEVSIDEISKTVNTYDKVTLIDLNKIEKELLGYSEGETAVVGIYLKKHLKHYNLAVARKFADKAVVLGVIQNISFSHIRHRDYYPNRSLASIY